MKDNFASSLQFVLADEGGNDDDPDDSGGRTSRGIIQREYDAWRLQHGEPLKDVWLASDEEIQAIYEVQYWQPWCDAFDVGVDYLFFDMSVNSGPHEATLLLQRALDVRADGHIGLITRGALDQAVPIRLIAAYSDERRTFYRNLHQSKYLRGWLGRADRVEDEALKMAANAVITA